MTQARTESSLDVIQSTLSRAMMYSRTKPGRDVAGQITPRCPCPASNIRASYSMDVKNHFPVSPQNYLKSRYLGKDSVLHFPGLSKELKTQNQPPYSGSPTT